MEFNNESTQRATFDGSVHKACEGQSMYATASSTRINTITFMHKWSITQFTVQRQLSDVAQFLESKPFGSTDSEYEFRMKLFPHGKDEQCRDFVSLFLEISKCPPPKLRFRVNLYVITNGGSCEFALNRNAISLNRGGLVTASKFCPAMTLQRRSERYIPDDVLTIGVELTVYGERTTCVIEPDEDFGVGTYETIHSRRALSSAGGSHLDDHTGTLDYDLGQLLVNSDHSDFSLIAGRRTFKCHKAILSARSPFFQGMFRNEMNQESVAGKVILKDITPEVIWAVLEYIYKGYSSGLIDQTAEILAAADRFCLDGLKLQCQQVLVRDTNVANVCEHLRLADMYDAPQLKKKALCVFQRNQRSVLQSRDWSDLEAEYPRLAASTLKEVMSHSQTSLRLSSLRDSTTPIKRRRVV